MELSISISQFTDIDTLFMDIDKSIMDIDKYALKY